MKVLLTQEEQREWNEKADARAEKRDERREIERSIACSYCFALPGDQCLNDKGWRKRASHLERRHEAQRQGLLPRVYADLHGRYRKP